MAIEKVWLDTDIGNDIDDSVALAYLLKHPACALLGISTVSGQPITRAKLADALCKAAGKDIPIYPGLETPILTPQRQAVAHQSQFLPGWAYAESYPAGRAIEAMYEAIVQNPGEVTILAIGPMTNIAVLLKAHPDIVSLVKGVVVMCGEFFGRSLYMRCENEWNAYCDPYAAAILYGTAGLPVRSVGLDVTSHVVMEREAVERRFRSPLLQAVYAFGGFESGERTRLIFHDPLAAVSIFEPAIMTYQAGTVSVELHSERAIGRTYFDKAEKGLHTVADTVNTDAFYDAFFAITAP